MALTFWRRHAASGSAETSAARLTIAFSDEGVTYQAHPPIEDWLERLDLFSDDAFTVAMLAQLEEQGLLETRTSGALLRWEALYSYLSRNSDSTLPILSTLKLPAIRNLRPALSSAGSLEDREFRISLGTWTDDNGSRVYAPPHLSGAVAHLGAEAMLLPEPVWRLVAEVREYNRSTPEQKKGDFNRRTWARIRKHAITANAPLDNFLKNTVVITPKALKLRLVNAETPGGLTLQVEPVFDGAPARWLEFFDRFSDVPQRYDIPAADGVVQVIVDPEVRHVLKEIRRWPGRLVSGQRAEAFVRNPFAVLGADASLVINSAEFEAERERAGIAFKRFSIQAIRTESGALNAVELLVESASNNIVTSTIIPLQSHVELAAFIGKLARRLAQGYESVTWQGHELELLGDAQDQLAYLRALEAEWTSGHRETGTETEAPSPLVRYTDVYDLSKYSERIEGIGVEKPYLSPFIARKDEHSPWIPENTFFGVFFTPEGADAPVSAVLGEAEKSTLQEAIAAAKTLGALTVEVPGVPGKVSLAEAEQVLASLGTVDELLRKGEFTPPRKPETETQHQPATGARKSLLLRANIDTVNYLEERRATLALPCDAAPLLPAALKAEITLKDHQLAGVAWLQHLYRTGTSLCRGALLADDMGLGKTVQLLTFIQSCIEQFRDLDPVLIVAPVSLLENWVEEIDKFFVADALPKALLYGDFLKEKKLTREEIDPLLVSEGIVRFLRPGWLGGAKVVLTTYETLRDLEFSLAAQRWSIMVCDEAQKIKNPNALVTRAAKKQNVQFKIACTGTPVENSLADLWCLFDFIQPGLLGSLNQFGTRYRQPIEAKQDHEKARVDELRAIIEPQTLRRTKKQVAKDLPQKIEVVECRNIPLSLYQRKLYAHAVGLFKNGQSNEVIKNHLGMIQYLRQLCTDPKPVGHATDIHEPLSDYLEKSPKMRWLLDALMEIKAKGEKAIVFVEFQSLQRLLQRYIRESVGFCPDIINGATTASASAGNSRQKRIKAFQERPGFGVIILSPLAVGFGVNIQAANHVIHYTRTWNPAKEDQATDRAYRIGATKDVYVYYPVVTADFVTFDMKLDTLLEWKRGLSEDMLNGCGDLSAADFGGLGAPDGTALFSSDWIQPDELTTMNPKMFECFLTILYAQLGYSLTYRTPDSNDAGVDVVAIKESEGLLIQCKTTSAGHALGWEAVKDVVAGTAFYEKKHPGVVFRRIAATNASFNSTAQAHAAANNVELLTLSRLQSMVSEISISRYALESMLVSTSIN